MNTQIQKTGSDRRKQGIIIATIIVVFLLFLALYMKLTIKPQPEAEKPYQPTDTEKQAVDSLLKGMDAVETVMRSDLADFGFETKIPVDTWYSYDQNGDLRYFSQPRYSNYMIIATDPYNEDTYTRVRDERILIGNEVVGDPNDYEHNLYVTQACSPNDCFYIDSSSDKEMIFVDPKSNTTYKTTYIIDSHQFDTEVLDKNQYIHMSHK